MLVGFKDYIHVMVCMLELVSEVRVHIRIFLYMCVYAHARTWSLQISIPEVWMCCGFGLVCLGPGVSACALGVCVCVCHQKSMVAHLVVFRPGLWWQTAGDERSSALQFRMVPTKHLRHPKH